MPKEAFDIVTPYGWVKDRLERRWKQKKHTAPDSDRIAVVLEKTAPRDQKAWGDAPTWLSKSREVLGL